MSARTVELSVPKHSEKAKGLTASEMSRIMSDPVYFVDNYVWTFDPLARSNGHHLMPFKLYDFQKTEIQRMANHIRQARDLFYEKSRDMGVSWMALSVFEWFWLFEDGFQSILGSRLEEAVDNFLPDSLFGKIDIINQNLPFAPEGFSEKNRTRLKLINPMNGNTIKGESSNPNWSRSGRYKAGLMDEIAFWNDGAEAWGAAQDACDCVIAITTPPKKPNFAKALRNSGIVDVVTLHWNLHPKKDQAWYEHEKETRLPEDLAREVDINWEGSLTGRYYPEIENVRLGDFPYVPHWPLWVSHDPGHRPDPHAITFWQVNPENGRYRLLESFERFNKEIKWFYPFFHNPRTGMGFPLEAGLQYNKEDLDLIVKTSQWKPAIHFGDPYGNTAGEQNGLSIYDMLLADCDINVNVNTKAVDHDSRRRATVPILRNMDVNDTPGNRYWLECMKSSVYPDIPDGSQRTSFNDKPVHNWASHLRSSTEYFSVNVNWTAEVRDPRTATFNNYMAMIQSKKRSEPRIGR